MKYHERLAAEAKKRRAEFHRLYKSGLSCRRIGEKFGISSQRVHQILTQEKP